MKITFVMSVVLQNGGCRVVATYAEKLLEMGHDVTVVSRLPQTYGHGRRVIRKLQGKTDRSKYPNRTVYFDGLGDRHIQIPWKEPLEASDVPDGDVIIATWWRTAFEVAALPSEKGAKVYFVQGHEVHRHQPWDLSGGSYWLPLKKITIADWLVDTMADRYGDHDVAKVSNSVDLDRFHAPSRERNDAPAVGVLYSKEPFKGIDVALKAIEIAREKVPDLRVLAFGASDPDDMLPLPEGTEYHKLPAQDVIRGIYAKCDAWLFSSREEGFGLPILEAMACRTPVVATRAGAAPDLIEAGVTGFLSDIGDAEGMAENLVALLSLSPEAWKTMSTAAHARVRDYTWNDAARAFEAELLKIVSTHQG